MDDVTHRVDGFFRSLHGPTMLVFQLLQSLSFLMFKFSIACHRVSASLKLDDKIDTFILCHYFGVCVSLFCCAQLIPCDQSNV